MFEYLKHFPTMADFKESIKKDDDFFIQEFFNEWIDTNIDGLQFNIMSDSTSESLEQDEEYYINQEKDEDVYVLVANNLIEQLLNEVRSKIPEEKLKKLMTPKEKRLFVKLKKETKEAEFIAKL